MKCPTRCWLAIGIALAGTVQGAGNAALRVPGFTAYLDPNPEGARVSSPSGVNRWNSPELKVLWFGEFKTPGEIQCSVVLRLPEGTESRLKLSLGNQAREATATGAGTTPLTLKFGAYKLGEEGYQRFSLESLNAEGTPCGDIELLVLEGAPARDAHFNLQPRRNAASVHLAYPVPKGTNVAEFYCEVTGVLDPVWTYYMACGWHRGYFGMQVNSQTERRIIFSVWDSGNEGADRGKVVEEDRVTLVAKGEDVSSGDFGNEGTGGHSHLVYPWKTGQKQRFFVTAKPVDATHTVFSGFYFHPDKKEWMLISSWKAPKDGGWLRGLYSFSENFGGSNGYLQRKALYGNQWIRTSDGEWMALTTATFSHDPTGKADRLDCFMGVEDGQFFLSQGGFLPGYTASGEKFTRPSSPAPPKDILNL